LHVKEPLPTRIAETMSEVLGDTLLGQPAFEVGADYHGHGEVPTKQDLRGVILPGDWVQFEAAEGNASASPAEEVTAVSATTIDLKTPLNSRAAKGSSFKVTRLNRIMASNALKKGKAAVEALRSQHRDGIVAIMNQEDLADIVPHFFGAGSEESTELAKEIANTEAPWAVRFTWPIAVGKPGPVDKSLCTVFSSTGAVTPLTPKVNWLMVAFTMFVFIGTLAGFMFMIYVSDVRNDPGKGFY
jgi:hypothetical protein